MLFWRKPANNSYNFMQDFLTIKVWVKVEQLIKILKPFISAIKCIKGNINNLGLEGLYGVLWESIINMEFFC